MTYLETIAAALEAQSIYNVDFQEVKDRAARDFDRARESIVGDPYFYAGKYEVRTDVEHALWDAIGFNLHSFPSKKLQKLLDNHLADLGMANGQQSDCVIAVMELIELWQPVAADLKALKPMVIKGRKPSATPRKTKERTIENTGTCAVCGKNVKMDNGRMVSHGFTIRYGWQMGNCFGVGYPPIEVSPEGAEAYRDALVRQQDVTAEKCNDEYIAKMIAAMSDKDRKKGANQPSIIKRKMEAEIYMLGQDIFTFSTIVNRWEAKPLPDAV